MNNKEYIIDILPSGLKVIYVNKKGFQKKFVGIGTLYGAIDCNFTMDGKDYNTFPGIAHFIEHKLFEMPGGIDAFQVLTSLSANSNAYTAQDKTMYYFTTTEDIAKPLKVLMDFVFTPYFDKKSVEREKSIIKSEIQMYQDYPDYRLETEVLRKLYSKSTLEYDIAGSNESVDSTKPIDLLNNYQAFYQPSNLSLVIVGDFDLEETRKQINTSMTSYKLESHDVVRKSRIDTSEVVAEESVIFDNVSKDKVAIGIKLDKPTNSYVEDFAYDAICNIYFGDASLNYQEMLEEELITNDFNYQVVASKEYRYILFQTETDKPDEFIASMNKRIKDISLEKLPNEDVEIYLKMMLGESISYFDNIYNIGESVLQYSLYGLNFFEKIERLSKIEIKDILPYVSKFVNAPKTIVKMLKKEDINQEIS